MSKVSILNDATFDDFIMKTRGVVVVLFWAPWCGHCSPSVSTLEELSDEMLNVTFILVNKDEGKRTADKFIIGSVPFFLFLKNGKIIDKLLGGIGKEKLRSMIYKFQY